MDRADRERSLQEAARALGMVLDANPDGDGYLLYDEWSNLWGGGTISLDDAEFYIGNYPVHRRSGEEFSRAVREARGKPAEQDETLRRIDELIAEGRTADPDPDDE